jgi:hypothetical protein
MDDSFNKIFHEILNSKKEDADKNEGIMLEDYNSSTRLLNILFPTHKEKVCLSIPNEVLKYPKVISQFKKALSDYKKAIDKMDKAKCVFSVPNLDNLDIKFSLLESYLTDKNCKKLARNVDRTEKIYTSATQDFNDYKKHIRDTSDALYKECMSYELIDGELKKIEPLKSLTSEPIIADEEQDTGHSLLNWIYNKMGWSNHDEL